MLGFANYVLTICEKPDAAKKIAKAIATDDFIEIKFGALPLYVSKMKGKTYVVCYSVGHLYTLTDPSGNRHNYPVFDVEWVPIPGKFRVNQIINVIKKLARSAAEYVNACDFDHEGEVIGYNILQYACGSQYENSYRAKFSTLTEEELRNAFLSMKKTCDNGLAKAGLARHVLDFLYGVNLSRALTETTYKQKHFRNLTIGRVQGPTLSFLVDREKEIKRHVPLPYWSISATFAKDGESFHAQYEKERISKFLEAKEIVEPCRGKDGKVVEVKKEKSVLRPLPAFNLGDLQKEAYKIFRFSPSFTLSVAERLYLNAMISYPRTSSQKLPASINYTKIIENLAKMNGCASIAKRVLKGKLTPNQGYKTDPAHPAIYPTGARYKKKLGSTDWKLYDLIVKRFFATFGEAAIKENEEVVIDVNGHLFKAKGVRTIEKGWTEYYAPYSRFQEIELPQVSQNELLKVLDISLAEKFTQPPPRFNEATLIEKMEKEEIGTKATRGEIIRTLLQRGYVTEGMEVTELGFAITEILQKHVPEIISTQFTRNLERQLEDIEFNKLDDLQVIRDAASKLSVLLQNFRSQEDQIGDEINQAISKVVFSQNQLGSCPVCKNGMLRIIRSKRSGKRFVGCSNYEMGCRAAMPLPQTGTVRALRRNCKSCNWPLVLVRIKSKFPWKTCINIKCPLKKNNVRKSI